MSAAVKADAKPVKPSVAMPPWVGILGLVMFCVGCLAAGLGISQNEPTAACAGLVFLSLGGLSMANGYTGSVRADLLHRIAELERRLNDEGNAEPSAAPDPRGM